VRGYYVLEEYCLELVNVLVPIMVSC
jgi:hypothetical protein